MPADTATPLTIGVDVGGTKIAAGLVDEDGQLRHRIRRPTPTRDAAAAVRTVCELVGELQDLARLDGGPVPRAVGIGAAGFVDGARRNVLFAANLGWVDEALADEVERSTGCQVVVENDANSAAWAEFRFGAGTGGLAQQDMLCVTVGTGIGGGVVLGGALFRGAHGLAAEFGHMRVVPDGRSCGCGQRGCWEQYASGNALVRAARELAAEHLTGASVLLALGDGTPEGVRGTHVTTAARSGDPVALAAFAQVGCWLGQGLADLCALFDPQLIVIGGGLVDAGLCLLGPARATYREQLSAGGSRPSAQVVPALLGNAAGIIGAADLARYPS